LQGFRKILDALAPLWGVAVFDAARVREGSRAKERLPENAHSVIVAAFPFLLPEEQYRGRNVARYAVPRDYHLICGARLERACAQLQAICPGEAFAWFCDNSPLPELATAVEAGLGLRGRHNLLITRDYGSWVMLGEIVTSLALEPSGRADFSPGCADCGACRRACPAGALDDGEGFDRSRCLSGVTQERRAPSPEAKALLRKTGSAWGCDLCQEVCPWNRRAKCLPLPEFTQNTIARADESTQLSDRAYAWRGKQVFKRNLQILKEETP
jgi:epoxyqueuosine reductase QueG